ncbi:AraC family transcriptional regulator [Novosphingobium sp. 1949]|uniref:AraC family transcriptional regulator n=1 Tax=Novosphingobium organovorum TaxID=2930092 RepID=A0ABT0BEK7_9SPHN|nr:helix-turn-helix domain-containing protein [Novosphingobium organovorum]MCJ2183485.1 AraC family transcriptional regulator [Novosphingobium organovorum]
MALRGPQGLGGGQPPAHSAIGSVSAADVPRYALYGEVGTRTGWSVNVEPLDERCRERGWIIAPHTHPRFLQIGVCGHGGGEITLEGTVHRFRPGTVMVVPPFCIHGYTYDSGADGWMLTVERGYLAGLLVRAPVLQRLLSAPRVFDMDHSVLDGLDVEFRQLREEMSEERYGGAIAAEIHLQKILLQLLRHCPETDLASGATSSRAALVERFKGLVEARYREQPPLSDFAAALGVSVSQLRLACNAVSGLSPVALIHERVLGEARRCLAYTGMSVSEISNWLGFNEAAYFSRFFTRRQGQTPSAYRRAQGFAAPERK